MRSASQLALLLASAIAVTGSPVVANNLPVVDLGYELHQALSYNSTTDVYKFSNIRYAQAPSGHLRFRAPQAPLVNRTQVQNGSRPTICPQGIPGWQARSNGPIRDFSYGKPFSLSDWEDAIKNSPIPSLNLNAQASEDCLLLDVYVPGKILDHSGAAKAPVLAFIHGGGYILGSKNFDPSGLLMHAKEFDDAGMIFVGINYRLGALGFLPGPEVKHDGDLNAGLLDQRFALEWIQRNIHIFGGDRDRVTAMGESAGGGSILLHMTHAPNDTNYKAPFAQAIPQSPAFVPTLTAADSAYRGFLSALNVSSLDQARQISSEAIIQGNALQVGAAPETTYIYGPVLDPKLLPEPGMALLKKGFFDKSVKVLAAHNAFEGGLFFDPLVETNDQFDTWCQHSFPGVSDEGRFSLANEIYPAKFDQNIGYVDQGSRQMAVWGEAVFDCNFLAIGEALQGNSYAYQFNVTPGLHTQDLKYTFNDPTSPAYEPVAQDILQTVIASFVVKGEPMTKDQGCYKPFPTWGKDRSIIGINANSFSQSMSTVNETRCAWWQSGVGFKLHS